MIASFGTYPSRMRMNLATKASRWKITFYETRQPSHAALSIARTYTAVTDAMLIEGSPLDNLCLESIVNPQHELECQCLDNVSAVTIRSEVYARH